jgi:RimJ/RimL family protein N-acetyltransferase
MVSSRYTCHGDFVTSEPEQVFLADPGTLMATTHQVGDGLRVRLRLSRPSDTPRVRAFLEGLSPETRHLRFFTAMPTVPEHVVRHFTFYNPRERLIVVAAAMIDGHEQILGLADVVLLDTGVAELAVVVDDELQQRGVGKLLTEVIASLAVRQGATHLYAELLDHNVPMRRLMERLGRTVHTVQDGTSQLYTRLAAPQRRAA